MAIFGWSKKKPFEDKRAYQLGEKFAGTITEPLEAIMKDRFEVVRQNYLDVLRYRIQATFSDDRAPTIHLARNELKIFVDNTKEIRPRMLEEIREYLKPGLQVADEMDVRPSADLLIASQIETYLANLAEAGIDLVVSYCDALKEADAAWRQAHPDRAAEFPPTN
jgi:hypothetical protein